MNEIFRTCTEGIDPGKRVSGYFFHLCPSLNLGAMILKTYTGYVFSSPPFILFEKVY